MFNEGGGGSTCKLEDLLIREGEQNLVFYHRIRVGQVQDTLTRMENHKVNGDIDIPIKVWKCLGEKRGVMVY